MSALTRAWRAERLATTRTRMASTAPSLDLGDVPEGLEPSEQFLVAGGVGLKALRAEQPAEGVEGGSHMDVEVRVNTTSHPTRSSYDGHGHPFC